MAPLVTLIVVVSEDGFVSRGRGVPWDLPEDKAHFRAYTAGKWLLLGRMTFEEMRGWFSDHLPLVLSRDVLFNPRPGRRVGSVSEAIDLASADGATELVVCGGAAAYEAAMPFADRLILTQVGQKLGEGLRFPMIDPKSWLLTATAPLRQTTGSPPCVVLTFERRR